MKGAQEAGVTGRAWRVYDRWKVDRVSLGDIIVLSFPDQFLALTNIP